MVQKRGRVGTVKKVVSCGRCYKQFVEWKEGRPKGNAQAMM